ncbi:hypothetical protein D3C80_2097300 [compost metagenome]
MKDVSYEVTEMSITEYGTVAKNLLTEILPAIKDFARLQEEMKDRDLERQQKIHEMCTQSKLQSQIDSNFASL